MSGFEIKQSATPRTIEIYIYADIEGDGYDWWTGEKIKSETSANHFRDELSKISEIDNINIYINSLGGSVKEATAIYNQLKRHKAYKTVYIDGFACSAASVVAMAGDKVVMPRNTVIMVHNAWAWCSGNATELRKEADDLDKINSANMQAYLMKSNGKMTEEELVALLDNETWLTAKECMEYGLADEYGENDVDIGQAQEVLQKSRNTRVKARAADKIVAMGSIHNQGQEQQAKQAESEQAERKAITEYVNQIKKQYKF